MDTNTEERKGFAADWRNFALIGAAILIIILCIAAFTADHSGGSTLVVTVGDKAIYDKDVVGELKRKMGDQVVMQLISDALVENYASQKNIKVTDADVDQIINFQKAQMEMQGQTLDKALEQQGMKIEELRKLIRTLVMQIKLIVPDEDIKANVAKYAGELKLPARYRVREFFFSTPADAAKALETMKKPNGLQDGVSTALNAKDAMTVRTLPADKLGSLAKIIEGMKTGEFSKPMPMDTKDPKKANGVQHIVQLVESLPEEKATYENRGNIVGQIMMKSDQKYQPKAQELEADALTKVDVQFNSNEFKRAHDYFQEMKLHNPQISGPGGQSMPGGQPGGQPPMRISPNAPTLGGK